MFLNTKAQEQLYSILPVLLASKTDVIIINNQNLAPSLLKVPGPGHYNQPPALTKEGIFFLSKFKSSQCRKFGSEVREEINGRGSNICKTQPKNK
jgi:hypothetical protein